MLLWTHPLRSCLQATIDAQARTIDSRKAALEAKKQKLAAKETELQDVKDQTARDFVDEVCQHVRSDKLQLW